MTHADRRSVHRCFFLSCLNLQCHRRQAFSCNCSYWGGMGSSLAPSLTWGWFVAGHPLLSLSTSCSLAFENSLVELRTERKCINCVRISHIFREGNGLADALANFDTKNMGIHWWDSVPVFLASKYAKDLASMPNYRT